MSDHNNSAPKSFSHEKVETNNFLLIVLTLLVVAVGGMVEIVPLFFQKSTTEAVAGLKPYTPLQLMGRDVYLREGCYNCHSQMIRPFRAETMRYGHYSVAGERSEEHTSELQSPCNLVCRLLLEKKNKPDLSHLRRPHHQDPHPHSPNRNRLPPCALLAPSLPPSCLPPPTLHAAPPPRASRTAAC